MFNIDSSEFDNEFFKYSESNFFEFKSSICINNKISETICAFLNSRGGYMIFGIADDLKIDGIVNSTTKDIDNFILHIDNILHDNIIIGNHNNRIISLNQENISVYKITNIYGKNIVVIKIIPSSMTSYQLKSGNVYYRLSASNKRERNTRFYSETEYKTMNTQTITKCNNQHAREIAKLKKFNFEKEKELYSIIDELNSKINIQLHVLYFIGCLCPCMHTQV